MFAAPLQKGYDCSPVYLSALHGSVEAIVAHLLSRRMPGVALGLNRGADAAHLSGDFIPVQFSNRGSELVLSSFRTLSAVHGTRAPKWIFSNSESSLYLRASSWAGNDAGTN